MKIVRDLFTEADGATWDLGRLQWVGGVLTYFGLSAHAYVFKGQAFEPVAWGSGLGAVLASGGAMIWAKDKEKGADGK